MIEFTPPAKSYSGYIFDCDGTLADTMPIHLESWQLALQAAGAPFLLDGKRLMSVAGMSILETIDHWNETHRTKIDVATIKRVKDAHFPKNLHRIRPIEPVVAFARACAGRGARVSVASGGGRANVLKTLELIGVNDLFPVVVAAEDVPKTKPEPDLFLEAARRMGVDPADCLVIEDSPLGIEAANRAGMDSILIPPTV
jgi:beta-phosphoglucomutase-like phosphatase (HAD superfamily)